VNSKVRRFEDLVAWQQAMDLAVGIFRLTDDSPLSRDYGLRNQLRNAALSVPSNIAEGFERGSRAEFHRFLSIAKASCAELRTQIEVVRRLAYITDEIAGIILTQANITARTIGKLRVVVAKQRATPLIPHAPCPMPESSCSSKT
jgi:four helix bundle protein